MGFNFYEIWHLMQIKLTNYVVANKVLRIDDLNLKFPPVFIKFGTHNISNMLIMNIILVSV